MNAITTLREITIRDARQLIDDNRLIEFFRSIRKESDSREINLLNQKLDNNESLDSLLYTGYPFGFCIIAKQLDQSCFEIYFGFLMGFSGGTGNWWKACFDGDGNASSARMARKTPAREISIQLSRRLISDNRLIRFLIAAKTNNPVIAIDIVNRHLDNGATLDSVLYTGEEIGFQLLVEKITDNRFEINFGCQAGSLAGDSGSWNVIFGEDDQIKAIEFDDASYIVS